MSCDSLCPTVLTTFYRFKMAGCSPAFPRSDKVTHPSEWSDEDRMSYLLAPFPPSAKPLPLDDPKFSFWSSFILSSSRELRRFVVSARDLQERFRWNGQTRPGCLSVVLESMEKTGAITKLADFYSVQQSWMLWGANLVKKPVSWALKSYLPVYVYEGEYVINCVAKVCKYMKPLAKAYVATTV